MGRIPDGEQIADQNEAFRIAETMTTPNNTVAGLAEKLLPVLVEAMDEQYRKGWEAGRALASPAPSAKASPNPLARYWMGRAEFWMQKAIALGWREVRDAANGEAPSAPPSVASGFSRAWDAVTATLTEVAPGWDTPDGTCDKDRACNTIRRLATAEQPCCMCGKKVDTRENGTPGAELTDGRWTCSPECFEKATEQPGFRMTSDEGGWTKEDALRYIENWCPDYVKDYICSLEQPGSAVQGGCQNCMKPIRAPRALDACACARLTYTPPAPAAEQGDTFQRGVEAWMGECFPPNIVHDRTERGDRLLEEVLELLQSHGYDRTRVATLVDYVYGRPVGEPAQEVGGVMVTLAAYCMVAGLNMHDEGDRELARITQPEVMAKIRRKQEAKNALHFDAPLPGNAATQPEARGVEGWP